MKQINEMDFATKQIHGGKEPEVFGALNPPIYMTSTFRDPDGSGRFKYSRTGNPSVAYVENKVALLENGEAGLALASGTAAISAALWTALNAGEEVVCSDTVYGCTMTLLQDHMARFGVKTTFVDMANLENLEKALTEKTTVVYLETPCNPTLKILDIQAIAEIVHRYNPNIKVFVDNTFCSPYVQRPLELGADVVVHSATKYINGHGDVLAGFIVGGKDFIAACRKGGLRDITGATLSPMNAFLVARGLKTLDIRMEKHCANAIKLARFLESHPTVKKVAYPGLESFEGYEIAKKQMSLPGAMMAVELNASREQVGELLKLFQLCTVGASLGDAETLVEHPATMTHKNLSAEALKEVGIGESMLRISVGLEGSGDQIAEFKEVLDTLL